MIIRPAIPEDLPMITAIYNQAVRETTAIWNDAEVDCDNRRAWLEERQDGGFPVLVAADSDHQSGHDVGAGGVLGYATYGPWRPFEGYSRTVEHSVYVTPEAQGAGVGRELMEALITHAREAGMHVMVAGIEAENTGSIRLHEKLGFTQVGLLPEVGRKFGRWLDLAFLQLTLNTVSDRTQKT